MTNEERCDRERLSILEAGITEWKRGIIANHRAVRDTESWRALDYHSFEDYCLGEWNSDVDLNDVFNRIWQATIWRLSKETTWHYAKTGTLP